MELTIKGLKTMDGPDSLIFQASVYIDGKRRFVARNDGNGGCHMYDLVKPYAENRDYLNRATEWAKTQPERTCDLGGKPFSYPCELDCIIDDLIYAELDRRWLKSQCRNKTVFRLADAEPGQWMVVDAPFDDRVKSWILNKYPGAVIANETI